MAKNPRTRSDKYWDFFIADAKRLGAPLYVALSEAVRHDDELLALAELSRPGQPPANMLFGAVHFLLMRGSGHPLRDFYPTLGGSAPPHAAYGVFRGFCRDYRDALAELIATRATNTNEVGRCVYLLPAFVTLAAEAGAPLHLIEIGASAGLNLYWDRYGYRYIGEDSVLPAGVGDAPVVLQTLLRGPAPPLGPAPPVGFRVGIDREPVDLEDADQRDWLRALVWPDHPERLTRLDCAIRALPEKPDIRQADALAGLPELLAEAPRTGTLCVFHTMTTYQFSREDREGLDALLAVAGLRRPVWRVGMEFESGIFTLRLTRNRDGTVAERVLAVGSGHGNELTWRG